MSTKKETLKVVSDDSSLSTTVDKTSGKSSHGRDWAVNLFWKFASVFSIVMFSFFVVGFTMVSIIPAIGVSLVESSGLDKIADASMFVWVCAFIIPYAFGCLMLLVGECALIVTVWRRLSAFCTRQADMLNSRMKARAVEKLTGGRMKSSEKSEKHKFFSKKDKDGTAANK